MQFKTIVAQPGPNYNGRLETLFFLMILDDNGAVVSKADHMTAFEVGCDIDAQIAAVNADITSRGFAPVEQSGVDEIKAIAAVVWTPERLAARQEELKKLAEKEQS